MKSFFKRSSGSYRSGLEKKVREYLDSIKAVYGYESEKLTYIVPEVTKTYTPDFIFIKKNGDKMYIETKGYWDNDDRKKHFLIKASNPNIDLRFVFSNPNTKIRKGSKTSYGDVCCGQLRGHADFKVPYAKVGKYGELPIEWVHEIVLLTDNNTKKKR